jgi:hypothetical protein
VSAGDDAEDSDTHATTQSALPEEIAQSRPHRSAQEQKLFIRHHRRYVRERRKV